MQSGNPQVANDTSKPEFWIDKFKGLKKYLFEKAIKEMLLSKLRAGLIPYYEKYIDDNILPLLESLPTDKNSDDYARTMKQIENTHVNHILRKNVRFRYERTALAALKFIDLYSELNIILRQLCYVDQHAQLQALSIRSLQNLSEALEAQIPMLSTLTKQIPASAKPDVEFDAIADIVSKIIGAHIQPHWSIRASTLNTSSAGEVKQDVSANVEATARPAPEPQATQSETIEAKKIEAVLTKKINKLAAIAAKYSFKFEAGQRKALLEQLAVTDAAADDLPTATKLNQEIGILIKAYKQATTPIVANTAAAIKQPQPVEAEHKDPILGQHVKVSRPTTPPKQDVAAPTPTNVVVAETKTPTKVTITRSDQTFPTVKIIMDITDPESIYTDENIAKDLLKSLLNVSEQHNAVDEQSSDDSLIAKHGLVAYDDNFEKLDRDMLTKPSEVILNSNYLEKQTDLSKLLKLIRCNSNITVEENLLIIDKVKNRIDAVLLHQDLGNDAPAFKQNLEAFVELVKLYCHARALYALTMNNQISSEITGPKFPSGMDGVKAVKEWASTFAPIIRTRIERVSITIKTKKEEAAAALVRAEEEAKKAAETPKNVAPISPTGKASPSQYTASPAPSEITPDSPPESPVRTPKKPHHHSPKPSSLRAPANSPVRNENEKPTFFQRVGSLCRRAGNWMKRHPFLTAGIVIGAAAAVTLSVFFPPAAIGIAKATAWVATAGGTATLGAVSTGLQVAIGAGVGFVGGLVVSAIGWATNKLFFCGKGTPEKTGKIILEPPVLTKQIDSELYDDSDESPDNSPRNAVKKSSHAKIHSGMGSQPDLSTQPVVIINKDKRPAQHGRVGTPIVTVDVSPKAKSPNSGRQQ